MLEKIIIATGNEGKFREFEFLIGAYAKNFSGKLIFAPSIAKLIIEETGASYSENAELKARAWVAESGLACLADDSGLEVEALDGAPGIFSARVAKGHEVEWILNALKGIENRRARFVASLALCLPDSDSEKIFVAEGICSGKIINEPRGNNGFGYDPVFIPDGFNETFAELDSRVKNAISHRAIAFQNLLTKFDA